MAKTRDLASAFIKQSQSRVSSVVSRPPINAFNSLFSIQEPKEKEYSIIEKLLLDEDMIVSKLVREDVMLLSQITQEVKAIKKQEMLLIGERISVAREIFKRYKEKNFRKWLESTFGSFKTGYNYMSFYDLYKGIPESLQDLLKEMPAKAAYVLASKKVTINEKAEIVRDYSKESATDIISFIHKTFGDESSSMKGSNNIDGILSVIEKQIERLFFLTEKISLGQKKQISYLIKKLQNIELIES